MGRVECHAECPWEHNDDFDMACAPVAALDCAGLTGKCPPPAVPPQRVQELNDVQEQPCIYFSC